MTGPDDARFETIPPHACYVTAQFAQRQRELILDPETVADLRDPEDSLSPDEVYLVAFQNTVIGTCGRVCINGCRMAEAVENENSPIEVADDVSEDDKAILQIPRVWLDYPAIDQAESMSLSDRQVKAFIDVYLKSARDIQIVMEPEEMSKIPEVSNGCCQLLNRLTGANTNVIVTIVRRMVNISLTQQDKGSEAVAELYKVIMDNPLIVTKRDLINALLVPDRYFNNALKFQSRSKSKIV